LFKIENIFDDKKSFFLCDNNLGSHLTNIEKC
jgi:hypothetical protein